MVCPRFATRRSILLLTVAVLLGGCATNNAVLEARKRYEEFGCSQYDPVNMPACARYFDPEVVGREFSAITQGTRGLYQRVTIHDAQTGRITSATVPPGAILVK